MSSFSARASRSGSVSSSLPRRSCFIALFNSGLIVLALAMAVGSVAYAAAKDTETRRAHSTKKSTHRTKSQGHHARSHKSHSAHRSSHRSTHRTAHASKAHSGAAKTKSAQRA